MKNQLPQYFLFLFFFITRDKGYFIFDTADLYQWISEADKANLQVTVHAIGDNAIHSLLNIYERVIKRNKITSWRIERVSKDT